MAQDTDDLFPPGASFGKYTIEKRLGSGGMGAVYEATHNELKKKVAIKTLHAKMAKDPELRTRFQREGESAARIRHPHVVDIYDVGCENDISYLVMEYLEGQDLARLLAHEHQLSPQATVDVVLPIAAALQAAHDEGVIHRDLKPPNIFLAKGPHGRPTPKILDFGISKIVGNQGMDGLTTTGALLGTPFYMSPEQAHGGRHIDARTDQYSLGVIIYQCLTGKRPFVADSMYQVLHKIVEGHFEPPRTLRPEIPEALERVIVKAMARDPNDRYPSLIELGRALLPFASARNQALWEQVFLPTFIEKPDPTGDLPKSAGQPAFFNEATPSPSVRSMTLDASTAAALPRRLTPLMVVGGLLLVIAIGFVVIMQMNRSVEVVTMPLVAPEEKAVEAPPPPPPAKEFAVSVSVEPSDAKIVIDGAEVGTGRFEGSFPLDGKAHAIEATAKGYEPWTTTFTDAPPPNVVNLRVAVAEPTPPATPPKARGKRPPPKAKNGQAKALPPTPPRPPKRKSPDTNTVKEGANQAPILR